MQKNVHKWQTWRPERLFTISAAPEEEEGPKSKKRFRSQSVVSQNPEMELMLEGDDDAVSLLQEKEIDNLAGIPDHSGKKGNWPGTLMVFIYFVLMCINVPYF